MEASGAVLRRSAVITGEGWLSGRRGRVRKGVVDDGHLRNYVSCGCRKEEKEKKKRAKLVKGLEKDLSALYSIGFGVEPEQHGLTGEIKSKMFSEAAEVLLKQLKQLKQLRLEEEEMERKRKEDKAAKKAAKMMEFKSHETLMDRKEESSPMNKKIEVCMGGKCKRSGGLELLEEIDKKVGIEGAVVGCKCMGKCRDGPNVRVLKKHDDDDEEESVKHGRNPLYIGVGLEDVGAIVANFLVEKKDLALSSAY